MFAGSIVALVTPFAGCEIDERAASELACWQAQEGSAAIAVNTVIGEGPTLTTDERARVVAIVGRSVGSRIPVIAGIGTSCTAKGIAEAHRAEAAGAHALLVVTPPYNRPTQEGLFRHIDAIAGSTRLPILVQNDPSRTRVDLAPETATRLLGRDNVVGLVNGAGDLSRALSPTRPGSRAVKVYTTQDAVAAAFLTLGGTGIVSALANVAPRLCAALHTAVRSGAGARASAIQRSLEPLARALGPEADPAAIKYALFLLRDRFDPTPRLPLLPADCRTARTVASALAGLNEQLISV